MLRTIQQTLDLQALCHGPVGPLHLALSHLHTPYQLKRVCYLSTQVTECRSLCSERAPLDLHASLLLAVEEEETTKIILGSEKGWILWTCRVFVGTETLLKVVTCRFIVMGLCRGRKDEGQAVGDLSTL